MEENNINKSEDKSQTKKMKDADIDKNVKNKENEEQISPEEELKKLEDKLARAYAEMENQRRRYEKEKDDAFEYGGFSFAKESLSLLDNLDRSKISLENDEKLKNSESLKKIFDHLNIIKKDMISIFKKNNIEQIETINKKLDPNYHQAMMEIEDDDKEPGTIVQEIQSGYMMKDRLLRPALVAVSKKRKKSEKNDEILKNAEKNDEN
tara:strand:+ start:132 stop:755 length:624 start_codon:yes stop_codon:yes gene_type:complete